MRGAVTQITLCLDIAMLNSIVNTIMLANTLIPMRVSAMCY